MHLLIPYMSVLCSITLHCSTTAVRCAHPCPTYLTVCPSDCLTNLKSQISNCNFKSRSSTVCGSCVGGTGHCTRS